MTVSASVVKELRDRTGAGMMECKRALVDTEGNVEAAIELLRTRGQAKAEKKAGRTAAEGEVVAARSPDGSITVLVEVNCETDFVAKDASFRDFARLAAEAAAAHHPETVEALMELRLPDGRTLEDTRRELVARIGENISIRRFEYLRPTGRLGSYFHGTRIGVLVDVDGGGDELGKDLAMHIAASNPGYLRPEDVPESILASERRILTEKAEAEGKRADIIPKMVEGGLKKYLGEVALVNQPFVKETDISVAELLKRHGARIQRFVRLEVGEGIEKKAENIADAVAAMNSQA